MSSDAIYPSPEANPALKTAQLKKLISLFKEDPQADRPEIRLALEELYPNGAYVFRFSTGSANKKTAALTPETLANGLIPRLVEPDPVVHAIEINPKTGTLRPKDYGDAYFAGFTPGEFQATHFQTLSSAQQAERLAFLKAWSDPYAQVGDLVVATDVTGKVGDLTLTKEVNPRIIRENLEKINQIGIVDAAVGCAVGIIRETPVIARVPSDFAHGNVRLRIHLREMSALEIDQYLQEGLEEIKISGWTVNVLGPICQKMELVEQIEIETADGFQPIGPEDHEKIYQIIAGYPAELIHSLFERQFPNGKVSGKKLTEAFSEIVSQLSPQPFS